MAGRVTGTRVPGLLTPQQGTVLAERIPAQQHDQSRQHQAAERQSLNQLHFRRVSKIFST